MKQRSRFFLICGSRRSVCLANFEVRIKPAECIRYASSQARMQRQAASLFDMAMANERNTSTTASSPGPVVSQRNVYYSPRRFHREIAYSPKRGFMQRVNHPFAQSPVPSSAHSPVRAFTQSAIERFAHSHIHSLADLPVRAIAYSPVTSKADARFHPFTDLRNARNHPVHRSHQRPSPPV